MRWDLLRPLRAQSGVEVCGYIGNRLTQRLFAETIVTRSLLDNIAGTNLILLETAEHPIREIDQAAKRLTRADFNLRGFLF